MTDLRALLRRAEQELRATRRIGVETCARFGELPAGWRSALGPAVTVLGCPLPGDDRASGQATDGGPPAEPGLAGQVARLLLLRLSADTEDPRWSSRVLEDLVAAALRIPESTVGDLFSALVALWTEHDTALTPPVLALIKDLTRLCFTRHRREYEASDFGWLVERLAAGGPAPVAYLALLALPDPYLPAAAPTILAALAGTPQADEAARMLADEPA
jgi:hypothetical protein